MSWITGIFAMLFLVSRTHPTGQMLLEVEADQDAVNESGSLMDRVTAGLITTCREFSSTSSSSHDSICD
jgi:hypothetical protein